MTQKEGLKNLLSGVYSPTLRKHLVCEWLEDINWHSECALIQATFRADEKNLLKNLHLVDALLNPGQYARHYIQEIQFTTEKEVKEKILDWNQRDILILYNPGTQASIIADHQYFDYKACHQYHAFSCIFGFGLNSNEWEHTSGQKFVDELLQIIAEK